MTNKERRTFADVQADVRTISKAVAKIKDPKTRYWLTMFVELACVALAEYEVGQQEYRDQQLHNSPSKKG